MYAAGTLLVSRQDPTQERLAPPRPTPIAFPDVHHLLPEHPQDWNAQTAPDLLQPYSQIRKLSDVSPKHLALLNISLENHTESNIEHLFPTNENANDFLPSSSWCETSAVPTLAPPDPTSPPRALSNGRPYPTQHEFSIRVKELVCTNEAAYCALTRTTPNGQPPVRLAYYRKFYEALSSAASYWDTSRDEYIVTKLNNEITDDVTKRENVIDQHVNPNGVEYEPRKRPKSSHDADVREKDFRLPIGSPPPALAKPSAKTQAVKEPESVPGTYRGFRISNGAAMPDSYRMDAIRAFVEPIAWAFGFTLGGHRRPPVLEIKSLLVPIKLSGAVWRPPLQREKARAGCLEGPVLGISCRSETGFAPDDAMSVLDTLREVGALLCLAQERAREGIEEQKPGAGKWYTSVPRWGGGPGGEMGDEVTSEEVRKDEIHLAMEKMMPKDQNTIAKPANRSVGARRKLAMADAWRTLRVGVGIWDPRTEYCAVGKPTGSHWDEVSDVTDGVAKV